eukprot:15361865-Ditylum_brightwellii.AAC.1
MPAQISGNSTLQVQSWEKTTTHEWKSWATCVLLHHTPQMRQKRKSCGNSTPHTFVTSCQHINLLWSQAWTIMSPYQSGTNAPHRQGLCFLAEVLAHGHVCQGGAVVQKLFCHAINIPLGHT